MCRGAHPIGERARARLLTPSESAAVELFCRTALELSEAAAFCTEHHPTPADEVQWAVFFVRTGQRDQFRALDRDGSLLALGYRGALSEARSGLRTAMAALGDVDVLRVLAGQQSAQDQPPALPEQERALLTGQLIDQSDWEHLWRFTLLRPLTEAVEAVRHCGDWRPSGDDECAVFTALRDADPEAVLGCVTASLATPVAPHTRIRLAGLDDRLGGLQDLDFSPDGSQLALVGERRTGPGEPVAWAGIVDLGSGTLSRLQDFTDFLMGGQGSAAVAADLHGPTGRPVADTTRKETTPMTTRIGIDFGTANTVVAGWDEDAGRGVPIPLPGVDVLREAGAGPTQRVVPSLIAYADDGTTRRLGARVTADMEEDRTWTVFASTKSNVSGHAYDGGRPVGDRKVTGRQAATQFLGDIMALAVLTVEDDALEIVATAPVESFDSYRDWLVREVREGLPTARLRVVDEATAAAVGYSARLNPGDTFAVIDFGAGTLDVSVVRVQEPDEAGSGAGVRPLAKRGLELGGNTIDALLADHALGHLSLPHGDQIGRNRVFRRLLASAERAKRELATQERAVISAAGVRGDQIHEVTVTRAEFDALLRDKGILRRINQALRSCLDLAGARGFVADDIRNVFLVGGSCLIPAVQDLVNLHFDPEIVRLDRPLEAVAAGAAGIAGGSELFDHIQHDYAIRHVDRDSGGYAFETLVEAGTPYPTEKPVKTLTVRAIHEGQRKLGLAVYELAHATYRDAGAELEIAFDASGGARTMAVTPQQRQERSMLWLNEDSPTFLAADPPATAGEDRFRVEFHIDAHKRLTVTAYDLRRQKLALDRQPVVRLA